MRNSQVNAGVRSRGRSSLSQEVFTHPRPLASTTNATGGIPSHRQERVPVSWSEDGYDRRSGLSPKLTNDRPYLSLNNWGAYRRRAVYVGKWRPKIGYISREG
ncbi:hypothetical protein NPIL_679271 [Nephila pilipes]|uniref:Uncharacterized protein n=1 Tax=Nephila pilipes TaxID=299642 RepID=A0A8X6NL90_NEPPI|nr:hypothetical protein NPIL_679271 [Nephila pilipes]